MTRKRDGRCGPAGVVEAGAVEAPERLEGQVVDGQRGHAIAPAASAGGPAAGSGRDGSVQGVTQEVEVLVDHEAVGPEDLLLDRIEGGGEHPLVSLLDQGAQAGAEGLVGRGVAGRRRDVGDGWVAAPRADAQVLCAPLHRVDPAHVRPRDGRRRRRERMRGSLPGGAGPSPARGYDVVGAPGRRRTPRQAGAAGSMRPGCRRRPQGGLPTGGPGRRRPPGRSRWIDETRMPKAPAGRLADRRAWKAVSGSVQPWPCCSPPIRSS